MLKYILYLFFIFISMLLGVYLVISGIVFVVSNRFIGEV